MRGFLVGVIVFHVSLPDKSAKRVFVQGEPAIHHFRMMLFEDRWIRGSSPRMTLKPRFGAASIGKRISLVFCALQDARLHNAADEFPDGHRFARDHPAGYAICIPW